MAASVFISAKSEDYRYARQVYEFLIARGVNCFFADRSLLKSGRGAYRRVIEEALEAAEHMVVVASSREHTLSEWVEFEWGVFQNDLLSRRKSGNLLTILCGDLTTGMLPAGLRNYQALQFDKELDSLPFFLPGAAPKTAPNEITFSPVTSAGAYCKLPITVANPNLIVFLVDQSESMLEPFADGLDRQHFVAQAINRCIYNMIVKCMSNDKIRNRCYIVAIGYGQETSVLVAGRASEVHGQFIRYQEIPARESMAQQEAPFRLPIWVEPRAENGTPMEEAFDLAAERIELWLKDHRNNYPPVVVNITDGHPNDAQLAVAAAQRLCSFGTNDGNVLLFNARIGNSEGGEVAFPTSAEELPDDQARLLFWISSPLPDSMCRLANASGLSVREGARALLINTKPETLLRLLDFGSLVAESR